MKKTIITLVTIALITIIAVACSIRIETATIIKTADNVVTVETTDGNIWEYTTETEPTETDTTLIFFTHGTPSIEDDAIINH